MTRQPKTGTCIFCDAEGSLEGEHVFAQWLRKTLGIPGYRKHQVRLGPALHVARQWSKPVATSRVWCVCRACNHGWMKDLEDKVKPHLAPLARNGPITVP